MGSALSVNWAVCFHLACAAAFGCVRCNLRRGGLAVDGAVLLRFDDRIYFWHATVIHFQRVWVENLVQLGSLCEMFQ